MNVAKAQSTVFALCRAWPAFIFAAAMACGQNHDPSPRDVDDATAPSDTAVPVDHVQADTPPDLLPTEVFGPDSAAADNAEMTATDSRDTQAGDSAATDTPAVADTAETTATDGDATDTSDPWGQIRLIRDEWGIPHVLASSNWGAGYGLGWARSEDLLALLLRHIWTGIGRLTESDGMTVLSHDRAARLVRLLADVERDWQTVDERMRSYLEGFAAGINDYMTLHPDEVPTWAEPVQAPWILALGRLYFLTMQIARANRETDGLCPPLATLGFNSSTEFDDLASNAWALRPERTADGTGIFLGDPHMPFFGLWRMVESHIRTPDFEVAGGGFVALPFPIFGRSAHVAWSFTSNSPDHGDVYRLTLDPQDPEKYLFDGVSEPFESEQNTFRMPDGTLHEETLRWSLHGPIACYNPEAGFALAYRLTGFGQTSVGQQFLAMGQAPDLDAFEQAMAQLQLINFNFVAADNHGSVVYVWNGRVPRRNPAYDYTRPVDGTISATLWDADDPISYWELPRYRDPAAGFVQNCNNAPWNTVEWQPPQPQIMPDGRNFDSDDTERAWHARAALAPPAVFTFEQARALATQADMIPAEPMLPLLAMAWQTYGPGHPLQERLAPAFDVLLDWDGHATLTSAAPTLFMAWGYKFFDTLFPEPDRFLLTATDLTEEMALDMLTAMDEGMALIEGIVDTWRVPWGLFHGITRGGRRFPVESGQYPAVSMFNCNVDPFASADLSCTIGSAYTHLHKMSDPIESYTVMPFGITDRTDSPHFTDLTALYARRELKPLPFTDEQLAAHTESETVLHPLP